MKQIIFAGYTLQQILIFAGVVIAILVVLSWLKKLLSGRQADPHSQQVKCRCGWQGQVSRYAGRCPRCNEPLGQRKTR